MLALAPAMGTVHKSAASTCLRCFQESTNSTRPQWESGSLLLGRLAGTLQDSQVLLVLLQVLATGTNCDEPRVLQSTIALVY